MEILIKIENKKVKVVLLNGNKEMDRVDILEEHSLSKKLLPEIDKMLEKNKLSAKNIKKIKVESDQGESFTTTRIAKAVANAWNFAAGNQMF